MRFQAAPILSLFGGVMRTEIPVVRGTYDDITDRWTIEPGTGNGMGPIVGVGVSKKFADNYVTLSAEARIGKVIVNDADPQCLTPTGPPDANGVIPVVIPVMMSTAELNPTVGMLIVGVRISSP